MPDRPLGFCPTKRCPNRSNGPCEDCRRNRNKNRDEVRKSEAVRALYKTERWKRMSVAQRVAEPWCWYCLQRGVQKLAEETDHVLPASTHPELFFEPSNHRSACRPCNASKGDR